MPDGPAPAGHLLGAVKPVSDKLYRNPLALAVAGAASKSALATEKFF
jgi:hypothetical protein